MNSSRYVHALRRHVGHALVLLPSVTVLVKDEDNRVLLARHREGGRWVAPGGAIEPDERPADAAVREVWEETGLVIELARLLGVFGGPEFHWAYANGDEVAYVMTVFEGRVVGGALRPGREEILDLGYFASEDALELPAPAWLRLVLQATSGEGSCHYEPAGWSPGGEAQHKDA